ncbi:MAG: PP2C family protein-serine/threonine phosphatase [Myxococcota bacterium]
MNLSADTIIETSIELTQQLIEAQKKDQSFDGIKNLDDQWTIISKEDAPDEDEPTKLLRSILHHHNPMIPASLSHEVLQNHLSLMAPDLPVDFLPVLLKFFGEDKSKLSLSSLLTALESALAKHTLRSESVLQEDIQYDIGYDTHIGAHKALYMQTNQDSFYIAQEGNHLLLCVLDGISTSDAGSGDMASAIARNVIHQIWEQHKESLKESNEQDLAGLLYHMLREANFHICKFAKELAGGSLGDKTPMGTTAVVALIDGSDGIVATLGDSRAYLHTTEGTVILTGDHNLRGEKLRQGMPIFNEDEGYALIRYLGHFDINREEAEFVNPDFRRFKILQNESLLICSDGLTDYAAQSHYEFGGLLQEAHQKENANQACWYLTNQANIGGGGDNITVVFVKRTA